jgi:hypothetical protein
MARIAQLHDTIDRTRYFPLQRENVIGRPPEGTIPVDNKVVSRRHVRIARTPGTADAYFAEDISARGVYINFRRIQGHHPLKEGDRICVIRFHNVNPKEMEAMTPDQLRDFCDDIKVESIKAVADFTFGYVDVTAAKSPLGAESARKDQPQGLLAKLKSLLGRK